MLISAQNFSIGWVGLVPRPAFSQGKGFGNYWAISWLCWLSSIDFESTLITCLHDVRPISLVYAHAWMTWHYFIGLSRIKTVDSAQQRNRSIVIRPFSSWEVGSGYKTKGGGVITLVGHSQWTIIPSTSFAAMFLEQVYTCTSSPGGPLHHPAIHRRPGDCTEPGHWPDISALDHSHSKNYMCQSL